MKSKYQINFLTTQTYYFFGNNSLRLQNAILDYVCHLLMFVSPTMIFLAQQDLI